MTTFKPHVLETTMVTHPCYNSHAAPADHDHTDIMDYEPSNAPSSSVPPSPLGTHWTELPLPDHIFRYETQGAYSMDWMSIWNVSEELLRYFTSANKFDVLYRAGVFRLGDEFKMMFVQAGYRGVDCVAVSPPSLSTSPRKLTVTPLDPRRQSQDSSTRLPNRLKYPQMRKPDPTRTSNEECLRRPARQHGWRLVWDLGLSQREEFQELVQDTSSSSFVGGAEGTVGSPQRPTCYTAP